MITFAKQEIIKTVIIVWMIGTTGYFFFDMWKSYAIEGIRGAYDAGYAKSVDDLIAKTEGSGCQIFEVKKDGKNIQLVNGECLQQSGQNKPQDQGVPNK